MTLPRIGCHVDQTDPIAEGQGIGANVVQFFLDDPTSWKKPTVAYRGGAEALRQAGADADIQFFIHAPYIINVASLNNRIRIPSRKLLQQTVDLATEVGAAGVIVHGGHVTADDDLAVGFDNWRKCIDGLNATTPILIENTAGGTNAMARHLDRIAMLWGAIGSADGGEQVGFCLDTCHFHAGGEDLIGLTERITAITGRIDLVHVNDSRDAFDSGADRHANLGKGHASLDGLVDVVRTANAPLCLETPGPADAHRADLAVLRTMLS